ncbi:hypothetical protein D3C71_1512870 [compost metagenome]
MIEQIICLRHPSHLAADLTPVKGHSSGRLGVNLVVQAVPFIAVPDDNRPVEDDVLGVRHVDAHAFLLIVVDAATIPVEAVDRARAEEPDAHLVCGAPTLSEKVTDHSLRAVVYDIHPE